MKLEPRRKRGAAVAAVIIAAVLSVCLLVFLPDKRAHGSYTLTVLFTGDLHGEMEKLPYYYTVIQQERKQGNVLLLDCGDLFYGGPRQSQGGQPEAVMLAAMDYDAMTLGNNEFKCTQNTAQACNKQIENLSRSLGFPVLCANIKKDGNYLSGVKPYTVINKNGLRIAVAGLTTDKIDNAEVRDKTLEDPVAAFDALYEEMKAKSDIIIVLSHCEEKQNKNIRGAAAIIAGHVHQPTYTPQTGFNAVPIVRAGGKAQGNLGKLTLQLVEKDGQWEVAEYSFELCSVENVVPNKKLTAILNGL